MPASRPMSRANRSDPCDRNHRRLRIDPSSPLGLRRRTYEIPCENWLRLNELDCLKILSSILLRLKSLASFVHFYCLYHVDSLLPGQNLPRLVFLEPSLNVTKPAQSTSSISLANSLRWLQSGLPHEPGHHRPGTQLSEEGTPQFQYDTSVASSSEDRRQNLDERADKDLASPVVTDLVPKAQFIGSFCLFESCHLSGFRALSWGLTPIGPAKPT